jgi:hypothetical protein
MATTPVTNFLRSGAHLKFCDKKPCILCTLSYSYKEGIERGIFNVHPLLGEIRRIWRNYNGYSQEDSHEFLLRLF